MRWTIPNTLTFLRLIAAPGVAVMFLYFARPWADWLALILFLGAAITDYFDGYLARLWRQESRMGAMLDPIADKAMVVIALLVITGYSGMDPWLILPATLILFREVFVSGLREYLGNTSRLLAVTKLAKWKTTAQMVAIGALILDETRAFGEWMTTAAHTTLWIAVFLTLATGWDYFQKAMTYITSEEGR